jgi:hypothetical protein
MTREQKILKRKERRYRRIGKRIEKDKSYLETAWKHDRPYGNNLSWGRRYQHGSLFVCEMGYEDCELRGWCNGDC